MTSWLVGGARRVIMIMARRGVCLLAARLGLSPRASVVIGSWLGFLGGGLGCAMLVELDARASLRVASGRPSGPQV